MRKSYVSRTLEANMQPTTRSIDHDYKVPKRSSMMMGGSKKITLNALPKRKGLNIDLQFRRFIISLPCEQISQECSLVFTY